MRPMAEAMERLFHRLYDASLTASYDIKVTAAPHNRVVLERKQAEKRAGLRAEASDVLTDGVAHSRRDGPASPSAPTSATVAGAQRRIHALRRN